MASPELSFIVKVDRPRVRVLAHFHLLSDPAEAIGSGLISNPRLKLVLYDDTTMK